MSATSRRLNGTYSSFAGVTQPIQNQVFLCLSSWLAAGEINAASLVQTKLLDYAFEALSSDQLFDAAVAAVCFPVFFFARLYFPSPTMTVVIFFMTAQLVLGYSWQDSHLPPLSEAGKGIDVAWVSQL